MKITIEFLAQLRVAAGLARTTLECADGTRIVDVVHALAAAHGDGFRGLALDGENVRRALLVAVDGRQASGEDPLADGDVLVLGTPIAGG